MSAREGPNAARRKLEQAGTDPTVRTGSFPVPTSSGFPIPEAPAPAPAEGGGLAGFLRRLFGKRPEAR
jgi:hypothetical protein